MNFSKLHILVVGDVMEDEWIYGTINRKSPEADCGVLDVERRVRNPGGAANAAANLRALGASVDLVSCCRGIWKTRIVIGANMRHIVRFDTQGFKDLSEGEALLDKAYRGRVPDAVLISDYGKGTYDLLRDKFWAMMTGIHSKPIPIVVDPKNKDFSVYSGATVIMPNLKEFYEATNLGGAPLLIKKGRQGMTLSNGPTYTADDDIQIPGHNVVTKEVSGAGDTAAACVTLMLACGHSMEFSAHVANACAALVVAKEGVATVSIDELNKACVEWNLLKSETPKKPRLGFCNGCFDLFHPGHMWFLWQAAQQCEHLVVGVNSNDSVRVLKGQDRPIQFFEKRAKVVSSLHFVDQVVEVDDPDEFVQVQTRFGKGPDIVFRGPDQKAPPEGINWVRITSPVPLAKFSTSMQLKDNEK